MNSLIVTPPMMTPVVTLRSGKKFRNLSKYLFKEEDIRWIWTEIRKFNRSSAEAESTISLLASRYRIPTKFVMDWLQAYDTNEPLFHVPSDCPIDAMGIYAICNGISSGALDASSLALLIEQEMDKNST